MVVPVAGPVEPPNLAWRGCRRQCVKHGQNRCRSDTCAKQNNGPITRSKSETAPWCAHVQYVADSYVTMHVGTRQAVQLLLDTNSNSDLRLACRRANNCAKAVAHRGWGAGAGRRT